MTRQSFYDLCEVAIIGGSPEERLMFATDLRRRGISCYTELRQSKPSSMFKRACAAVSDGVGACYDIDDEDDRAYLKRSNCFREMTETNNPADGPLPFSKSSREYVDRLLEGNGYIAGINKS